MGWVELLGVEMRCPICDQRSPNCDCTAVEKRQRAKIEKLESEVSRMKMQSATEALAWSLGQMWASVDDRIPGDSDGEYVLVTDGSVVGLATHRNGWNHAIGRDGWEPTHWMPLPEPPPASK